ncbi:MAG TPA: M28 family peptidase, partial [Phycisphaerae bacterium]|nr:M28 family peptidase [Phycisphaerae bacterium]
MNRYRLAAIVAAIAAAGLAASGCKSTEDEAAKKEKEAKIKLDLAASDLGVAPIGPKSFAEDVEALTANPHRLAGYENGSLAASRYVEGRLRGLTDEIYVQSFPVVQPVTTECRLLVDGEEVHGSKLLGEDRPVIYPMQPNILHACVTPEEGLSGETIYARTGELADYGTEFPKDKIVLLDFDCERNWLNAFALGARAVIFIGQKAPVANPLHHINVPSNLPRFYVPAEVAEKLKLTQRSRRVTIKAACEWRELRGRNVIAVVRGTAPKFQEGRPDQALVLAAPLDSLSEVPDLSAGARDAANCAALLQAAEQLVKTPAKRDVILCFFDGQAQNHLGARAFYGAIHRHLGSKVRAETLDGRLAILQDERLFRRAVIQIIAKDNIFDPDTAQEKAQLERLEDAALRQQGDAGDPAETQRLKNQAEDLKALIKAINDYSRDAVRMLQAEAKNLGGDILEKLRPLRIERADKEQQRKAADKKAKAEADEASAELARKLQRQVEDLDKRIELLDEEDKAWSEVQRDLNNKEIRPEFRACFDRLLVVTREICQRRIEELNELEEETNQAVRLEWAFGKDRNLIVLHVSVNLGDARDRWGFIHGDDSAYLGQQDEDKTGNYRSIFKAIQDVAAQHKQMAPTFEHRSIATEYDIRWFAPGKFVDSGAIAKLFAIYNLSVMTALDRLGRQGQPADTASALNQAAMLSQTRQIVPFLKALADHSDIGLARSINPTVNYTELSWARGKSKGP